MWAKPTIYYDYDLSGLVASSELTGYEASKLLDRLESTWWKSANATVPMYITFDAGSGNTITADYLAISGHNLNTIGALITLQYSSNNFDVSGSDLLTNGGFGSDTTGWTAVAATLGSIAGGQTGNCLIVATDSAANGSAYQDVTGLTVGNHYKLPVYFKKGSAPSGAIKAGTTSDDDVYGALTGLTDADWTAYFITFKATETTARITFTNEATSSGQSVLFDTASLYLLDITDSFATYTPSSDLTFIKEFTSKTKRYWRLEITGTLSAAPYIAMGYWGELTEWDYLTAAFDPDAEEEVANLNESGTGVLLGDHVQWTKKDIPVALSDADDALYQRVKGWKDGAGLRNAIFAWNKTDYPSDIWVMRRKLKSFKAPFTKGGVYRNISFVLMGRVE